MKRQEQQARTRRDLLEAAARVYGERGLSGASLEQVASEAGYTKGAVYANFASRDELLLALLDDRFAERLAALDELLERDAPITTQAREGGDDFEAFLAGGRSLDRLFFDFCVHGARDEAFGDALRARLRDFVERLAAAIERHAPDGGPPAPAATLALAIFTTANGIALQALLDPDSVPPGFFGEVLELLALGALHRSTNQEAVR